jgi:hypothetical protein
VACPLLKRISTVVLDDRDFTSEVPLMTSWLSRLALLAALAPAAGCIIEIGDGDDDPPCYDTTQAILRVRDPYTGQCYPRGGGGGNCDGDDVVIQAGEPLPPGGLCDTYCENLGEDSCAADPGCQAAYVESCPSNSDCVLSYQRFAGCWAIAPFEHPGACQNLTAEACATRNDCSPVYENDRGGPDPSIPWHYLSCIPEQPLDGVCASDLECGPGEHCNLQDYCFPHPDCRDGQACPPVCYGKCEPDFPPECAAVDCAPGYRCEVICDGPCTGIPGGDCRNECRVTCVPVSHEVGECTGDVACERLPPACPPLTVAGIINGCWSGYCIPTSECGHDPGHCPLPGEPACLRTPPACPEGTVPGVENMCWTDYCIPQSACP